MGRRVMATTARRRRRLVLGLLSLAALLGIGLGGRARNRRRHTPVTGAAERRAAFGGIRDVDLNEAVGPEVSGAGRAATTASGEAPGENPPEPAGDRAPVDADFVSMHARGPVMEPTAGSQPAVWLSLPSAESLGFRGPGAFALPGGGSVALPGAMPLPRPAPPRGAARPRPGARRGAFTLADLLAYVVGLAWPMTVLAISSLALAMRLIGHSTNYDLFIDEITYSTIGQAVALGHGVSLYGPPFFLHPPLFFFLEGGLLDLFGGAHASPVNLVFELRPINCVIGSIECGLLMLLVSRITHRGAAVVVGVFVACDPFLLLWDGRVLLETMAMTAAVAGWLCLEWVARRDIAKPTRELGSRVGDRSWSPGERAVIVLAGLLFGVSLLSKETYGFVGVVPLLAMFVLGSPVRRRVSGVMFGLAAGSYAVYLSTVVASGDFSDWYNANVAGLLRAVGTKQVTGFNQAGHHASFGSRVGADLALYGISYIVIAAAAAATACGVLRWFLAARSRRTLSTQRRLAIVLGAGGVGYVGYAVCFGAFEVQIFYMCIISGLPVLVTEARSLGSAVTARLNRRSVLVTCAVIASLALAFEVAADVRLRTAKDTSLSQLTAYVSAHVHYPSLVDSTDGVTQFILRGVGIDGALTVRGLERQRPDYVVVDAGLVNQGYVHLGPGFQAWLNAHARVVYRVTGRSTGQVLLYRTVYADQPTGAQG